MASALPSNALYDVQKYLRQKRASGAQVTPQNERAAWSGYFDTMEQNSLAERSSSMQQQRLDMLKQQQKNEEGAATMSGIGALVSTTGQGALLLKGTDIGSKIGLGAPTSPTAPATGTPGTTPATAPITSGGTPVGAAAGAAPVATNLSAQTAIESGALASETSAAAVGAETGMLSAASPYLGPAGTGFAAGSIVPTMLGIKNETGKVAVGAASGALAGAGTGAVLGGEIGTAAGPGYGTAIGAVIGAVAGGIGAKVK